MSNRIRSVFESRGFSLSPEQCDRLSLFFDLLVKWNQRMNLTSITDFEEVVEKHFLDSALLLSPEFSDMQPSLSDVLSVDAIHVMDVGTGAGFPGLVLAILRPSWEITLLDSLNKRVEFLHAVISELGLDHVWAIHGRAEDLGREDVHRLRYDLVVSRAVADTRLLLEICMPFVSDNGIFVSYKGPKFSDELSLASHAMEELRVTHIFDCSFSLGESRRVLVGFRHDGEFPEKYPRRAGIPAKRPL